MPTRLLYRLAYALQPISLVRHITTIRSWQNRLAVSINPSHLQSLPSYISRACRALNTFGQLFFRDLPTFLPFLPSSE
jgi:hypothetical protein